MLISLEVVPLLCRIISMEKMRAIKEEAFKVAIAILLGGNETCQEKFNEYI